MRKTRLILTVVLAVLVAVVVLQNTEAQETRVLFATIVMPRAVLLLTTALIGFVVGVLTSLVWLRKTPKAAGSGDADS